MKRILILISITFLIFSCKDSGVDPQNDDFNINISVKNKSGNSVPNINVSIIPKLNYSSFAKLTSYNNVQATSTIRFDVIEQSYVDLSSYNLDGTKLNTFVSRELPAGAHLIATDWSSTKTNGVYIVKMTASSDLDKTDVLFQDSIYVVLIQPEPKYSSVAKTDQNGEVKISEKYLFPHLYNIPPIAHTSSVSPEPISSFVFSDSVIVALSNDDFSKSIYYEKIIVDGQNNLELEWDSSLFKRSTQIKSVTKSINKNINTIAKLTSDWKLYQNYPNPFN
ncbi:MAG: hypothetical protein K8F60_02695 [Melioribacteraceae bacterium]|nr:hypothetical protein [Melioribacteraceae bacterium]